VDVGELRDQRVHALGGQAFSKVFHVLSPGRGKGRRFVVDSDSKPLSSAVMSPSSYGSKQTGAGGLRHPAPSRAASG
jgi:hypothetical protein